MSPKVAKVSKATIGVADIITSLYATNIANMHEHLREKEKSFLFSNFCLTNDNDSSFT
jgi:hypothetical protein